jgi:hypothetical protein
MFPIQKILYFFKSFVPCGIFLTNFHLLIMDGHGSHVILKAMEQVQQIGLNIITLFFTHHMFSNFMSLTLWLVLIKLLDRNDLWK